MDEQTNKQQTTNNVSGKSDASICREKQLWKYEFLQDCMVQYEPEECVQ